MRNQFSKIIPLIILFLTYNSIYAQEFSSPLVQDDRMFAIIDSCSSARIQKDIEKLVSFGTRHTLSDTISETRGIGAARRWIKSEFEKISTDCNNCLEVRYQKGEVKAGESKRIPDDTWIVNVMAIKRGTKYPNRYVIMSGDIDTRVSDVLNSTDDSPGANDNATGMAGVLEAARVLSAYDFPTSIIFVGLSGEEQGLFGGKFLAAEALEKGWDIVGVLNNDMIGNIKGIDGIIDNSTFRVFSENAPPDEDEKKLIWKRFYGGEVDGPSRQLARYVEKMSNQYITSVKAIMIYRLDRFGRGGHHRPFNDAGFPGVRIMETHENYNMQHQDIRMEDGIKYGDVIEGVDFDYAAKLTSVNAITLAGIAWAPPQPSGLMIGGAVSPSTVLKWEVPENDHILGYKVYWRETTAPQWQYSRYIGKTDGYTLKGIVIDNYLFGVASVSSDGNESVVAYPTKLIPRKPVEEESK